MSRRVDRILFRGVAVGAKIFSFKNALRHLKIVEQKFFCGQNWGGGFSQLSQGFSHILFFFVFSVFRKIQAKSILFEGKWSHIVVGWSVKYIYILLCNTTASRRCARKKLSWWDLLEIFRNSMRKFDTFACDDDRPGVQQIFSIGVNFFDFLFMEGELV